MGTRALVVCLPYRSPSMRLPAAAFACLLAALAVTGCGGNGKGDRTVTTVARIIGDSVVGTQGTQGTPVEPLGALVNQRYYPELWQARNRLTELANEEE